MKSLKVIERNDQRVLTTAQLAEYYESDSKTISYNFNYNKERFTEGKHYFSLTGEDRKQFLLNNREIHDSSKHAKVIYLWTAKGAFMIAKTLGTNKAWESYEELVDDYFVKSEQIQDYGVPTTIPKTMEDLMIMAAENMKDLRREIQVVREENRKLKLVVDNELYLTETQKAEVQEAVKKRVGRLMKQGYEAHFHSIYSALKVFFTVPKYDKIPRKDYDTAIDFIAGWYPKKDESHA